MSLYQGFTQLKKRGFQFRIRIQLFLSLFVIGFSLFLVAFFVNDLPSHLSPSPNPIIEAVLTESYNQNHVSQQREIKNSQTQKSANNIISGSIQSGQSFYSVLSDHGFSPASIARFVEAYNPVFNCRKISPEDTYEIITDDQNKLVQLTIKTDPVTIYQLCQEKEGLVASKQEISLDKNISAIAGTIENSLFKAVAAVGEKDLLAIAFADIFAWDIDFRHDLRQGDKFKIIFEKLYHGDTFVQNGKILAAEYISRQKTYQAVFFKDPEGTQDYYTPEGNSLRRSFLRSPLRFSRISSGYSHRRFHPILKRYKPHLGIDFAAPSGTPVWSVADGVVIKKGWKNGNGNMVTIRHPNGYETMYNHLSRYGKGIKVGNPVKQKDVIGYVGTTGLSTGPHLDYRMKKNGSFINPLKKKFPPGLPVKKIYRNNFFGISQQMLAFLNEEKLPPEKIAASL